MKQKKDKKKSHKRKHRTNTHRRQNERNTHDTDEDRDSDNEDNEEQIDDQNILDESLDSQIDSPMDSVELPSPSDLPQKSKSEKNNDRDVRNEKNDREDRAEKNGRDKKSKREVDDKRKRDTKKEDVASFGKESRKDDKSLRSNSSISSTKYNESQNKSYTQKYNEPKYNEPKHNESKHNESKHNEPSIKTYTSEPRTRSNMNYQNPNQNREVTHEIKGSTKAELIVEAKKEYTTHLHLMIDNFFYDEFESLYQHCLKTPQSHENPLKDFLTRLRRIPAASDHYKARIIDRFKKAGGDEITLIGLLKALFITHVQLLLSIRTDSNKNAFQVDIPPIKEFLFQCMIEVAKGLYEMYSSNTERNYQKNMGVIKQAIEQAVVKHIPIKQILFSFREDNANPNNVTIIPCTPIMNHYNTSMGNMLRSPVVNQNWIPHTPLYYSDMQAVNLKEQKMKEDIELKQIDEFSDKEEDEKENEKNKLFGEGSSPPSPSIESESNEIRTIKTGKQNEVSESHGSKELNIKL